MMLIRNNYLRLPRIGANLDATREKVAGAAPLTIVSTRELSPEAMKQARLVSAP